MYKVSAYYLNTVHVQCIITYLYVNLHLQCTVHAMLLIKLTLKVHYRSTLLFSLFQFTSRKFFSLHSTYVKTAKNDLVH